MIRHPLKRQMQQVSDQGTTEYIVANAPRIAGRSTESERPLLQNDVLTLYLHGTEQLHAGIRKSLQSVVDDSRRKKMLDSGQSVDEPIPIMAWTTFAMLDLTGLNSLTIWIHGIELGGDPKQQ
jgi:hypothetical protein